MSIESSYPLISIITTVLNERNNFDTTVKSVIKQSYPNIEYIVIDGGSTDGTINIIKKYEKHITFWVSEKDNGISDAFNKGIKQANGIYINFQGAGDFFFDKDALLKMMDGINTNSDWLICGRIQRISESDKVLWTTKSKFIKKSLLFKMSLPHQALFTHKHYFNKFGLFDTKLKFSMDYDLILRSYHDFPGVKMKNHIVSCWKAGGIGSNKFIEIFEEYNLIKKKNKVAPYFILYLINKWILFKHKVSLYLSRLQKKKQYE